MTLTTLRALIITLLTATLLPLAARAQQYSGMNGLIQTPSAEMDPAGQARISLHFINHDITPNQDLWYYEGEKYPTGTLSLSLTPFSWIQAGYTVTLMKHAATADSHGGYDRKDRYFSLRLRPLREGRYNPAIVIGAVDFLSSATLHHEHTDGNALWRNFYIAATKHISIHRHTLGLTAAYRYYPADYNHRWRGITGGITYRPAPLPNLRAIAEWNGSALNLGIDILLFRHLLIQASLGDFRYPSAGLAYTVNLF